MGFGWVVDRRWVRRIGICLGERCHPLHNIYCTFKQTCKAQEDIYMYLTEKCFFARSNNISDMRYELLESRYPATFWTTLTLSQFRERIQQPTHWVWGVLDADPDYLFWMPAKYLSYGHQEAPGSTTQNPFRPFLVKLGSGGPLAAGLSCTLSPK